VNKAELTSALAMRTKMSKADATRTVEALFDDKGIIATELKKGAKVQIRLGTSKRASVPRECRNPKTGGVIQIKASGSRRRSGGQAAEDGGEQQEASPSVLITAAPLGGCRWCG
jgi:DNA-binding protein HU-beta